MAEWIFALDGTPAGAGTVASPLDINTLLGASSTFYTKAQPGDIFYIRQGVYASPDAYAWWPTLYGAPGNPVIIRAYPGERYALDLKSFNDSFILDNPLRASNVTGHIWHDVDWYEPEIFSSDTSRSSSASGNNGQPNAVLIEGVNARFIHPYIHDLGDCGTFELASNNVMYGWISMDHGWIAPDRGHGHMLYVENDNSNGSIKNVLNGFGFTSYDDGVQEYGTAALTKDINFQYNTLANAGGAPAINQALIQWMIGQNSPDLILCDSNVFFVSPTLPGGGSVECGWQFDEANVTATFTNNYVIGPSLTLCNWANLTAKGNKVFPSAGQTVSAYLYGPGGVAPPSPPQTFVNWEVGDNTYGPTTFQTGTRYLTPGTYAPVTSTNTQPTPAAWQAAIGGDAGSTFNAAPALAVLVNPSTFISGRVHITVWNPAGIASVPVNLSNAGLTDGAGFELYDAQNFGVGAQTPAVVMSGTYSAANPIIEVPATGLIRKPMIGIGAIAHTAPYLLTFVLMSGLALTGEWNPIPGSPLPPLGPPPPPPTPPVISGVQMTGNFEPTPTTLPAGGGNVVLAWSNLLLASGSAPTSLTLIATPAVSAFPAAGTSEPATHTTPAFAVSQTTVFTLLDASGDSLAITVPVGTTAPTVIQTWSVNGGALPAGLTLTAEGLLGGTPSASGPYSFTVNIVDSNGKTGTITYSGSVAAATTTPPATTTTYTLTPTTLPSLTVGSPVSLQLSAA